MHTSKLVSATVLIILGTVIGIGADRYWLQRGDANRPMTEGETALEHARKHSDPDYACPMHADVVAKQPGSCPVCGMDLVKREPAPQMDTAEAYPEVAVSPGFMHNFGVRSAKVSRGPVERRIVALGRISRMPQPRITNVSPGLAGKVISISSKAIGDKVRKGELMYTVDAPQWRSLQQQYLDALREDEATRSKQLSQRLLTLGLKSTALEQLAQDQRIVQTLDIHAPVDGTIVEWRGWKDKVVEAGTQVVTLGGMNRIPVVISLFEGQGAWINNGQKVVFRLPTFPATEFVGQVDRTDREINFSTRTLPVYAGFSTADPRIRYGMLVEATIHASDREDVLRIPREALIRTGEGDRVIVALGDGRFQPASVVPGLESGDYIEILSGVNEGQDIVVSGQFLIDSESSLKANFQRMETGDDGQ